MYRFVDGIGHLAAFTPVNPAADEKLKAAFPQPIADVPIFETGASWRESCRSPTPKPSRMSG